MEFAGQKFSPHDDADDVAAEFWLKVDEIETTSSVEIFDRKSFGL